MRRRHSGMAMMAAGAVFATALATGIGVASVNESPTAEAPAPPAVLQRVAARNERASALAAAEVRANAQENLMIADAEFAQGGAQRD